jgi:hypothetical protein
MDRQYCAQDRTPIARRRIPTKYQMGFIVWFSYQYMTLRMTSTISEMIA